MFLTQLNICCWDCERNMTAIFSFTSSSSCREHGLERCSETKTKQKKKTSARESTHSMFSTSLVFIFFSTKLQLCGSAIFSSSLEHATEE